VTNRASEKEQAVKSGTLACRQLVALVTLLYGVATLPSPACGPNFPNNLLDGGDAALLVAPLASFADELERMKLVTSRLQAKPPDDWDRVGTHAQQSLEAELADLRAALQRTQRPEAEIERICATHQLQREKLHDYVAARERWRNSGLWIWDEHDGHRAEPKSRPPEFPVVEYAKGLPAEFADYLEGFSAWHNPALVDKDMARQAWERLLARSRRGAPFQVHLGRLHAGAFVGGARRSEGHRVLPANPATGTPRVCRFTGPGRREPGPRSARAVRARGVHCDHQALP